MSTAHSRTSPPGRCRAPHRAPALFCSFALLSSLGGSAFGFTFVPVADEALVDGAPLVVLANVGEILPAAGGAPVSRVRAGVLSVLKGNLPATQIEVEVPETSGAPRFTAGGRALLFLDPLPTGSYRLHHLSLGAFREVGAEGRRYAVRDLATARTLSTGTDGKVAEAAASESWRDFDAFVRFVEERARGGKPRVDYLAEAPKARPPAHGGEGISRWFEFDDGGHVLFHFRNPAGHDIAGIGAAFEAGLAAWNDDPDTAVDLRYAGEQRGSASPGRDGENALHLGDPEGWLTPFSCSYGGVVALTVMTSEPGASFRGQPVRRLLETDIVLNRGVDCFFAGNGSPGLLLREVLAHEVGHALGLRHTCGDEASGPCIPGSSRDDALLRAQLHDDGRGARLAAEDRAALAELYGPAPPPAPPSGLTAHARAWGAIALSWERGGGGHGYEIEARPLLAGPFVRVATTPAEATGWVITKLAPETGYVFRVRALGASGPSSWSNEAMAATSGKVGPCLPDDHTLCLNRGRFRVRARFAAGVLAGTAGAGPVASDESGLFWFFTPGNWELALKVLDGCAANGHYWVFFAALTRVEHSVTVTDTWTGRTKVYWSAAGVPGPPVADSQALAVCP